MRLLSILFIAFISFSFFHCNSPEIYESYESKLRSLKSNIDLKDVQNSKNITFYFNADTIEGKIVNENSSFYFKCKKKQRLFRKKRLRFHSLQNKNLNDFAKKIISMNSDLKENKLIGVFSELLYVNDKLFFLHEEVDKILIESNERREGRIFKINTNKKDFSVNTNRKLPGDTILIETIKNLILYDSLNMDLIDEKLMRKFYSISFHHFKKFLIPNYFYLNPLTYKLEPIIMGITSLSFKEKNNIKYIKKIVNNDYLDYFETSNNNSELVLKKKLTKINKSIIIPNQYTVKLYPGEIIDLVDSSFIISKSPILTLGSEESKILIKSSDSTGQGLHIIQDTNISIINNLIFKNQFSLIKNNFNTEWILPSSFTVYGGRIEINNCSFQDLKNEDALNIFRSSYLLKNSTCQNTFSDAVDADFSEGIIENCNLFNCGNDAVDVSGGKLFIKNTTLSNVEDKAISAGEESEIIIENCNIKSSSLAIIAKDLSLINANNNKISNCEIAYCAFKKKTEYGKGTIISQNNQLTNCKTIYLIEFNSILELNNKLISNFQNNVAEMLYGKIFGKATVK